MFIDAGDFFINKEDQNNVKETIENDPVTNLFFWKYYSYKINVSTNDDNRLHGKAYKREFLNKYNIEFCPESSFVNEDVGFNRLCRLISNAIDEPILFLDEPIIRWVQDKNSLTQANNGELLYRKQTRGLSLNSIHTIESYRKLDLDKKIITNEIYEIAAALYYWFIRTASDRPEYLQEAWSGAKIFYDRFKDTPVLFSRLTEKPDKNYPYQTRLFLTTTDTRKKPFGLSLKQIPYIGKITDRGFATLCSDTEFSEKEQADLCEKFNSLISQTRKEYGNLLFSTFRDHGRKRISLDLSYRILSSFIS